MHALYPCNQQSANPSRWPLPSGHRFICALGLCGLYCFCTALCGLSGVKRDRRAALATHILLLAVLVLAQAAATLLLLSDNGWRERIPGEGAPQGERGVP